MNSQPIDYFLNQSLRQRIESNNLRKLTLDRASVDFYSNDYLGIATHGLPPLPGSDIGNIIDTRTGSTGARLLSGNFKGVEQLEEKIRIFHGTEAALIFNSGYDANLGLLSSIAQKESAIIYDELCHASILDGIRLSRAETKFKFAHNDPEDLEKKIRNSKESPVIIVAESVYSMDGDVAPLTDLVRLAGKYNAMLVVDEAHATGVFGDHGKGLVQHLKLEASVYARVHTFGKGLGGHGAVVVGSDTLKQYLINFARPFIYSTALPPHSISFMSEVYGYLESPDFTNQPLHHLISFFRKRIAESPLQGWKESNSAIQALIIGDPQKAKDAASAAVRSGMQVNAILHPSVAKGSERIRICLHVFNTTNQVDDLISVLEKSLC